MSRTGLAASASVVGCARGLSIAHRFAQWLREVVLAERQERIVVFVDEIDLVLQPRHRLLCRGSIPLPGARERS